MTSDRSGVRFLTPTVRSFIHSSVSVSVELSESMVGVKATERDALLKRYSAARLYGPLKIASSLNASAINKSNLI